MNDKYMFFSKYCITNELGDQEKLFTEEIKKKYNINNISNVKIHDSLDRSIIEDSTSHKLFGGNQSIIFLSSGTYSISESTLPERIVLVGLDKDVHIKLNKKLILTGKLFVANNIHFDLVSDVDYHMEKNFCTSGIIIPNDSEVCAKFRNCVFNNSSNISADSIYFGPHANNPSVLKCKFKNTTIKFSGYPTNFRNCSVKHNIFESSVVNFHTYSGQIYGNTFMGNSRLILFQSKVNIHMNTFKNVGLKLIDIDYSSNIYFSKNFVVTNPSVSCDRGSLFSSNRTSKCSIDNNTFVMKKNQAFIYCQWNSRYSMHGNMFNNPDIVLFHDGIKMKHSDNNYYKNNIHEDCEYSTEQISVPSKTYMMFDMLGSTLRQNWAGSDKEINTDISKENVNEFTFEGCELVPINIIATPINIEDDVKVKYVTELSI